MRTQSLLLIVLNLILLSCAGGPETRYNGRRPASLYVKADCSDLMKAIIEGPESMHVANRARLKSALEANYSDKEVRRIQKNLDSLHFIDYKDLLPKLLKLYKGTKSLSRSSLYRLYDSWGFFGLGSKKAFKNHEEALQFLQNKKPPFNLETLKTVHSHFMHGGIDSLPKSDIGDIRTRSPIGNIPPSFSVTEKTFKELENNPYVSVDKLTPSEDGLHYSGFIEYPNAKVFTKDVENIIKNRNEDLYRRLIEFRDKGKGNEKELTREMVNELTEDLLEWFVREKDQIGDLTDQDNLDRFTELAALFQRHLVSIHPFSDGNGRSSRAFALYYPFLDANLPPPRLLDPNNDIYQPFSEWKQEVLDGVRVSQDLYKDLIDKAEKGLPLENSPYLLSPKIPKYAKVDQIQQSTGKRLENHRLVEISPAQFAEYYYQKLTKEPQFFQEIANKGDVAYTRLINEYEKYLDISRIEFIHKKTGEEEVQLNFVDRDFMARFGDKSYRNLEDWESKMDRWYLDETVWRGLPSKTEEVSEEEILTMFKNIHRQYVSNNLLGKISEKSEEKAKGLIVNEFSRYNDDLMTRGLADMATDHSDTGPKYGQSYGYSTSKKRSVGKAFAMGAMVVAEYGKHQDYQHLLKSRVLVGLKRAKKDVDLMRLHRLRDEFWYKYARQQEVMGIGAADPDSLMFVQTLDEQGEVIRSYVRNPDAPDEVFVVDGEASAFPIDKERVQRVIRLD